VSWKAYCEAHHIGGGALEEGLAAPAAAAADELHALPLPMLQLPQLPTGERAGGHPLDAPLGVKIGWLGRLEARPAGGYAGSVRLRRPTVHRLEQRTKGGGINTIFAAMLILRRCKQAADGLL